MPSLMEVIEFLDNTGKVMARRVPKAGETEIKWGAQLTVRENQIAVFMRDGKALDKFGPGRYVLETQNIPLLTKLVTSLGYGCESPFRAEVYFLNMKLFPNLKWGTPEPILFKDSELQMIRLRAHGIFSIQIADPDIFLNKVSGLRDIYKDKDIEKYARNIVISRITDVLGEEVKTVFNLPASFDELSLLAVSKLRLDFEGLGLKLHDFFVKSISVPPEVQELIDTKSGMAAVGNMNDFVKFKTAMAMESAAKNEGGTAAAGVGVGAGVGMGFMMPNVIKESLDDDKQVAQANSESSLDKIKKLKELLDLGAITKEEFETKKKDLLEEA